MRLVPTRARRTNPMYAAYFLVATFWFVSIALRMAILCLIHLPRASPWHDYVFGLKELGKRFKEAKGRLKKDLDEAKKKKEDMGFSRVHLQHMTNGVSAPRACSPYASPL